MELIIRLIVAYFSLFFEESPFAEDVIPILLTPEIAPRRNHPIILYKIRPKRLFVGPDGDEGENY